MDSIYNIYPTQVGELLLISRDEALCYVSPLKEKHPPLPQQKGDSPLLDEAIKQLSSFFAGELTRFDLPLTYEGTDFQKQVWEALLEIPYGETRSYKQIAERINNPKAVRAVGLANNRNPISFIIPCHRVIGADGSLVGYGGGLELKKWLLAMEERVSFTLRS